MSNKLVTDFFKNVPNVTEVPDVKTWKVNEAPTPEELIESARKANEVIERSRAAQQPQQQPQRPEIDWSKHEAPCHTAQCTAYRHTLTGGYRYGNSPSSRRAVIFVVALPVMLGVGAWVCYMLGL